MCSSRQSIIVLFEEKTRQHTKQSVSFSRLPSQPAVSNRHRPAALSTPGGTSADHSSSHNASVTCPSPQSRSTTRGSQAAPPPLTPLTPRTRRGRSPQRSARRSHQPEGGVAPPPSGHNAATALQKCGRRVFSQRVSLCLSRACLGKKIVFSTYKMAAAQKTSSRTSPTARFVDALLLHTHLTACSQRLQLRE